ncbi:Hsp20/alpha crystallin family protein [Halalkalicoccus jeotgali]|uniref:Hsp20/alpha crystallin family protein n=1 Tax=Halalkalicoccus jeotgali (strain DSM 18796 / CECT 7217 / JCM 14584 / KCTC 4019 / B3) TaxID=795797 RepID=D8J2A4_HALJB|nr:Hsp20/alpha crystallin family protein [Halalkalicoccus jeotgali]ADJ14861.1 hypothetical protein HacjB3_07380 [Halalkalicoccus jeotgali B3]ELY39443.1 hypothetical protein C497_05787 [Halalkalicoccus jeotgali B3]
MTPQHKAGENEAFVRRYEYDDESVIAVDLGSKAGESTVDVVGDTAIVITETSDGEHQEEFDLPGEEARAFIRNGVLTIEVEQ